MKTFATGRTPAVFKKEQLGTILQEYKTHGAKLILYISEESPGIKWPSNSKEDINALRWLSQAVIRHDGVERHLTQVDKQNLSRTDKPNVPFRVVRIHLKTVEEATDLLKPLSKTTPYAVIPTQTYTIPVMENKRSIGRPHAPITRKTSGYITKPALVGNAVIAYSTATGKRAVTLGKLNAKQTTVTLEICDLMGYDAEKTEKHSMLREAIEWMLDSFNESIIAEAAANPMRSFKGKLECASLFPKTSVQEGLDVIICGLQIDITITCDKPISDGGLSHLTLPFEMPVPTEWAQREIGGAVITCYLQLTTQCYPLHSTPPYPVHPTPPYPLPLTSPYPPTPAPPYPLPHTLCTPLHHTPPSPPHPTPPFPPHLSPPHPIHSTQPHPTLSTPPHHTLSTPPHPTLSTPLHPTLSTPIHLTRPTDGPTDQPTDQPTDRPTDRRDVLG
jgi:hypothetical protein